MHYLSRWVMVWGLLTGCGDDDSMTDPMDAAMGDAATSDSTVDASEDASEPDSAVEDAGSPDASTVDASTSDANIPDAQLPPDAGGTISVSVEVSGLTGTLHVSLDETEELEVTADGEAAFTAPVQPDAMVSIRVTGQPFEQFCEVDGGEGPRAVPSAAVHIVCVVGHAVQVGFDELDDMGEYVSRGLRVINDDYTGFDVEYRSAALGDDGMWFTPDDESFQGSYFEYGDETGEPTRIVELDSFGDDGMPRTSDDVIESYWERRTDAEGSELGSYRFTDPGANGIWFTDDDLTSSNTTWLERTYDSEGRVTCDISWRAGMDRILDTADDEFQYAFAFEYRTLTDPPLEEVTRRQISDHGGNGVYCEPGDPADFTRWDYIDADGNRVVDLDEVSSNTVDWDMNGRRVGDVRRRIVGEPDFLSGETDDTVNGYRTFLYDALDNLVQIQCSQPGMDMMFFTDDDLCTGGGSEMSFVDAMDRMVRRYVYNPNPRILWGPDYMIGTPDDVMTRLETFEYDAFGLRCEARSTDPGPNMTWDTEGCGNASRLGGALDDVVSLVIWTERDGMGREIHFARSTGIGMDNLWATHDDELQYGGNRVRKRDYLDATTYVESRLSGAGMDTMPFTDDDELESYFVIRQLNAAGQAVLQAELNGPGPNMMFFTSDDDVISYEMFTYDRSGNLTEERRVVGPGPDNDWFTPDDIADRVDTYVMAPFSTGELES